MKGVIPGGINPDLVSLTGAIVTWWGMIEGVIVQDVIGMNSHAAVHADGECWPVQTATRRLISQWVRARRIAHRTFPDNGFDFEAARGNLAECAEIRNRLVHGFWRFGTPSEPRDDFVISTFKPIRGKPNSFEFERYLIDVPMLDSFNSRLASLYHSVMCASLNLHLRQAEAMPKVDEAALQEFADVRSQPPKRILD
jgi:hypothetical protein